MERMVAIYKLTAPNGKCYIGQSCNIHKRFLQYKGLYCKQQPKLYKSLNKYGWENFTKEILEYIPAELKDEYEQHYIAIFRCCETGLNLDPGGSTNRAILNSARLKMSIIKKGVPLTEEHKKNISLAKKGKTHFSNETLHNMSLGQKGRKQTEKTKLKISFAMTGKKRGK